MSLWVNAAAQSNLSTGVGHSALSHRRIGVHHLAGGVAAVTVNGVAAADFQRSSLFADGGQDSASSTPLVLSQNVFTNFAPVASYQGKKIHAWGRLTPSLV